MTVLGNGNIGIGVTAPEELLDVRGASGLDGLTPPAIKIRSTSNGTWVDESIAAQLLFETSDASETAGTRGAIKLYADDTTGNDNGLSFWTTTAGAGGIAERMRIDHQGNVGIGTTSPTYQLQLSTDSAAKPGTSTWTIASDERLKDIRGSFSRGLDAINALNPIYFNYKADNPLALPSQKEYVGIRAQDVQKVIPEAISLDEQGYLHVTNDSIIWTAINSIKELYRTILEHTAQIKNQNHEIEFLKEKNKELEARIEKLEKLIREK